MNNFTLALIAHDSKKEDMLHLVRRCQDKLNKIDLVATRGTGLLIQG
jgi:methylglyoxal synthase